MLKGFYNLTSAMLTHGRKLDVISNNMTNVSTAGFKADRFTASTFEEVLWSRVGNKNKVYETIGSQSFITAPSQLYTDYDQGSLDDTGLPLDFAIEGDGFFAIETDDGIIYTRNGNFSLDEEGYLWLSDIGRVLNRDNEPIQVSTDKVNGDNYGGMYSENGAFLGRVGVFAFADNNDLTKNELGLFVQKEEAAEEENEPAAEGEEAEEAAGNEPESVIVPIHQKMLEHSNVDLVQQMAEMISTQRAYQSAAEVIKIYDNMLNQATTEVGRL